MHVYPLSLNTDLVVNILLRTYAKMDLGHIVLFVVEHACYHS